MNREIIQQYVYEGIENESPISERKRLVNPHYFGGISVKEGDNSRRWQDVYDYIAEAYEIDKIKMIYINGDNEVKEEIYKLLYKHKYVIVYIE